MYTIETREVPEQPIATIERRVLAGQLPGFIAEGMTGLYTMLGQAGVKTGIPFVLYHGEVNVDSDGPVELCVPYQGQIEPSGETRLRVEPAHREAYTRITKDQVESPKTSRPTTPSSNG